MSIGGRFFAGVACSYTTKFRNPNKTILGSPMSVILILPLAPKQHQQHSKESTPAVTPTPYRYSLLYVICVLGVCIQYVSGEYFVDVRTVEAEWIRPTKQPQKGWEGLRQEQLRRVEGGGGMGGVVIPYPLPGAVP